MPRIFDVIEYFDEMRDELVHRIPEAGTLDIRLGSQVIAHQGQAVVLYRDGVTLDIFGPGRHTITTANAPLLTSLLGYGWNGRTPFSAAFYIVSSKDHHMTWSTEQPLLINDPNFGVIFIHARGNYSFSVNNPQRFVTQQDLCNVNDVHGRLLPILLSNLHGLLNELRKTLADLITLYEEIASGTRAKAEDRVELMGIHLSGFHIENFTPDARSIETLSSPSMTKESRAQSKLREMLVAHFNESELRDLCFDLKVDYETLPGGGKGDKARELILYLERRRDIPKLLEICNQLRPNVSW